MYDVCIPTENLQKGQLENLYKPNYSIRFRTGFVFSSNDFLREGLIYTENKSFYRGTVYLVRWKGTPNPPRPPEICQ